jgi:hypothetical protein
MFAALRRRRVVVPAVTAQFKIVKILSLQSLPDFTVRQLIP